MLPLVGFTAIAAIYTVAAYEVTLTSVDNPRMKRSIETPGVDPSHIIMRRSDEEFAPVMYRDDIEANNDELALFDPEDELDEEAQRFYTEERMGKRSIALGRSGFRPGKRSLTLGRLGFRPGKRSFDEITDPRDLVYLSSLGKRSMAMGRMGFRPGKRSMAMGRVDFRPGKRSAMTLDELASRIAKRSMAMGRVNFRPGKRSVAMGRLGFRPGK
ncbi:hypothetical protein Y032_0093g2612 [Ancylostoma ceylanicum]|uniref:Uncharacterized protein n=1 Tax=Ancylostoma ceylanicum TaxID=53326 RepID=A0A016TLB1_9BILA|nr:hypothetical protein Y032_0093g2612 [Ancylostoma ceylanicum]